MKAAPVVLLCLAAANSWAASADAARCRAHGSIDTCYDAIRRTPTDPSLLASLGDAFARANRSADALRSYKRAAILAPGDRAIAAKVAALEKKSSAKRPPVAAALHPSDGASRRYSNAALESESH